ncbi:MAG: MGMT family protein [Candidatus Micrarchaeota archaeon]|nr:MGMT family protein [Candidatus Micrarchaeota archaeon]
MARGGILKELERYGLTKFQKDVLVATMSIKKGRTMTYKAMAAKVGHKRAYRAVGTALKKNPLPIRIPCHRVIKSDGTVGNYNSGGKKRKLELLMAEGAIK